MPHIARSLVARPFLLILVALAAAAGVLAPAGARAQSHAPIGVVTGANVHNERAIELHNRGYAYARLGYYLPAVEAYSEALKMAPSWATAYANRAMVYRQLGEPQKALADVEQSIELDRNMVTKWQGWLQQLGFYGGAVDGIHGPMTAAAIASWAGIPPAPAAGTPAPAATQ